MAMRSSVIPLLVCWAALVAGCRREIPQTPPPPPLPQVSGMLTVDGLLQPVRVVRDRWGVPHIYAQSEHDVFFAQGFVQAQDRLFQMDLWRRSVQGRLSEVLGPNFVERDAMTRRMQYRGDLNMEWASYGPDVKVIATAFVNGINAWIQQTRDRLPEEFTVAGWKPELWTPDDLVNRTDAFVLSVDAELEVVRARLVAAAGELRARRLLGLDRPIVVPRGLELTSLTYVVSDAVRRVGTPPFFAGMADEPRTAALPNPSRHYVVHLNAPGLNAIGGTSPWLPALAVGHNDRVAWELTPYDADSQDIFVEHVNPANPHQVEYRGRWIDTTIVKDPIVIKGRATPFEFEREYTRHGVVIASDREQHRAFTVQWSGTEPGGAGPLVAVLLNRAQSWTEFRDALARWKTPAVKVDYRDVEGFNGRAVAALVPRRASWNGDVPAPGWPGTYEWTGWLRPDDLPPAPDLAAVPLVNDKDPVQPGVAEIPQINEINDARQRWLAWMKRREGEEIKTEGPVMFTHPLAVTTVARQRFNIGPVTRTAGEARPFYIRLDVQNWDRTVAMNAPGQSGSPGSPHFDDLARRWAAGESIPLVFTGAAVAQNTETTLTLSPRVRER